MKEYGGRKSVAVFILNLNARWRWVVSFTPSAAVPPFINSYYPLNRSQGGPQSLSGCTASAGGRTTVPEMSKPWRKHHVDNDIQAVRWLLNNSHRFERT